MKPAQVDKIPAWVAYSGVAVVGGVSLIVLAYYQHLLGVRAGMPESLSWSLSIALDWGSAVAGVFWFFGLSALKKWGRWTAVGLLAGSTAGSCVAWGLTSGWEWAPLGVVHPCVFFLMAKLLTLWQAQRSEAKPAVSGGRPVEQRATAPTPALARPPTDDRIAAFDAAMPLVAKGLGWKALRTALGKQGIEVNEYRARQLVTDLRADRPLHAVNS